MAHCLYCGRKYSDDDLSYFMDNMEQVMHDDRAFDKYVDFLARICGFLTRTKKTRQLQLVRTWRLADEILKKQYDILQVKKKFFKYFGKSKFYNFSSLRWKLYFSSEKKHFLSCN